MKNKTTIGRYLAWLQACIFLLLPGLTSANEADLQVPYLKSGTVVYSNVTVFSRTDQDLYISHAQGLGNVKISTLDDDSLRALGLKVDQPEPTSMTLMARAKGVTATVDQWKTSLGTVNATSVSEWTEKLKTDPTFKIPKQWIWNIGGAIILFYLLFCLCLRAICRNAGAPAGVLIFIPVLQLFPLLRAAKMSLWWFIPFVLFPLSIIMQIWWSFRITKACGKGVLTAILLIVPVTSIFAFLYLVFSKNTAPDEPPIPAPSFQYNA